MGKSDKFYTNAALATQGAAALTFLTAAANAVPQMIFTGPHVMGRYSPSLYQPGWSAWIMMASAVCYLGIAAMSWFATWHACKYDKKAQSQGYPEHDHFNKERLHGLAVTAFEFFAIAGVSSILQICYTYLIDNDKGYTYLGYDGQLPDDSMVRAFPIVNAIVFIASGVLAILSAGTLMQTVFTNELSHQQKKHMVA